MPDVQFIKLTKYQRQLLVAARSIKVLGWFDAMDWIHAMKEPVRDPSVDKLIKKGLIEKQGHRYQVTELGRQLVTYHRRNSK